MAFLYFGAQCEPAPVEEMDPRVTREEIIARLWNRDVFVDVETGINTAIRMMFLTVDPKWDRYRASLVDSRR